MENPADEPRPLTIAEYRARLEKSQKNLENIENELRKGAKQCKRAA